MLRDKYCSDTASFDPGAVVNAFELVGQARSSLSILIDLKENVVIYADVYLQGGAGARVERDGMRMSEMLSAAARAIKTSITSLVEYHLRASGAQLVDSRDDADVCIGVDDSCDYNVFRPEKLMADLC